jgi:hypothetical protein
MDTLDPPDVVGSLLADEKIDMLDLQLIPGNQGHRVNKLVEAADIEFDPMQIAFSQPLVLFAKVQIVSHFREEVVSSHRRR